MPGNELTPEEIQKYIEESSWKPSDPLVYFDPDTGELRIITGELQADDPNFIRVNPAEIADLVNNKASPADYRVIIDFKTNEYILQNILDGDVRSFNWNDEVYQIPKEGEGSITLVQDKSAGTWTLKLTDKVRVSLSKQAIHAKSNLAFYATKPDDVNVLYGILKFRMIDITTNGEFTIEDDSARYESSVFCRRVFDSYRHIEL
jgi:hypothetical protein